MTANHVSRFTIYEFRELVNILVLLHAVRDPRALTVNRKAQKVFVNRDDFICNPGDKNALEAALRLGGNVTAVAFGTGPSETVLRDALALGAGRAVLVRDELLHNVDASLITLGLQRVIEKLGNVELVLLGAEVLDGDFAQVGPRVAAALGWPLLPPLHQLEATEGVARGIARHPVDNAFHRVEADLPAVAPIARDSNKPRYANAAHVVTAFSTPDVIEVWSAAELGLTASDLTGVIKPRGESFPPERELGKRLEGDVAGQLSEIIRKY
jgi:electron transfer flavoprotein beta subunit